MTISLESESNLIHQGRGYIYELVKPSITASNTYITLSCDSYPCITKVNATLSYSGEMTLYL